MAVYRTIEFINSHYDIHEVYEECLGRKLTSGKVVCPNPEHHHVNNTPSAKCYGNGIKCFGVCNRFFGPYDLYKWYKPERIDEIRSTMIFDSKSKQSAVKRLRPVPIDRTQSIEEIVHKITGK